MVLAAKAVKGPVYAVVAQSEVVKSPEVKLLANRESLTITTPMESEPLPVLVRVMS